MGTNPEALLISSVIRNGDMVTALKNGITSDMFHLYRDEWAWLERYFAKHRESPDREAFKHQFDDFMIKRTDGTAHFCDEVRKSHIRHELLDAINLAADALGDGDIDKAVRSTIAKFVQVSAKSGHYNDADIFTEDGFADILADSEARVIRFQENGSAGIPFGFPTADEATGGANPGEFGVVGARLGVGKSWLMQVMATNAVIAGYNVQFDALEMTRSAVSYRIHSLLSGRFGKQVFASQALMQGKEYNHEAYKEFVHGLKDNIAGQLNVSDTSRGQVSVATIAAQIERNQPDIVYVDYITLMQKTSSEWQGVAQLSGELKSLAANTGVPIITASQLNRQIGAVANRAGEPADSDAFAQSDSIGQDADWAITAAQWSPSVLKCKMAKVRNGKSGGVFYVQFQPGLGVIKEITANQAERLRDRDQAEADRNNV
jgi:replicative DNA helicase